MAAFVLALELLAPKAIWLVLTATMLFSLVPTPLQTFLLPIFHRGKLIQPSSSPPWFTVPQRFFLHFYIVGTLFNGFLLLLMLAQTCVKPMPKFEISREEAWRTVAILFLFELQVLRRLYESLYVSKFSRHARMHILAYLLGLLFYVLASLSLFPRGKELMMNLMSGYPAYKHGIDKFEISLGGGNPLREIGWRYWISGAIFFWGSVHQHRCHVILASLRSSEMMKKDDAQYKIPYGDWFEYVSSAHYLAEFVIYFSFVVATGGQNINTWLLFVFTILNLSIAADDTHKWYRRKFKNYPRNRKAIVPFLY
eukprot:c21166_g3_i1 orf=133-1062(+)